MECDDNGIKPDVADILENPECRDYIVRRLQELQEQAELDTLMERADEELALDMLFSHRYTEE